MNVPIDSVTVNRSRFREATGDMEGLATSVLKYGLLQPIVLDKSNELVAGYRRLTAFRMNGATEIPAVYVETLDELTLKEMELEENLQRQDMTWQEEDKAIAELDAIRRVRDPNWTQPKTAQLAGVRQAFVSEAVSITNAMKLFPELANAKDHRQAYNWMQTKIGQIARVASVKDNNIDFINIEQKIWLGDSRELIKQIPDESFHAIITDPPFGVDYDKRTAGTIGELTNYKDDAENYLRILAMAPEMYRTLKPNGWLIFFYGMSWHSEVQDAFTKAGFTIDPIPIVWDRSDGRTFTNVPSRYFTKGYDVALHGFKGNPKLAQQGKSNVLRIPPVEAGDRDYLVERPVELYSELIRRLTIQREMVADFFVGSGSCPAAAASLGRDYFGIERDEVRRAGALKKILAHSPHA